MASGPATRRRRLPLFLIGVGSLLAFLAIFALWANRQLLDTDNWTDTSSELLENDDIRGQVSIFLVDQLYANVDVEDRIADAFPRAQSIAGPVAGGLKDLAIRGVDGLLERPRPQALWEEANRRAHRRLLQVLEGGGDNLSTEGGNVTLDLKSLLGQTADSIGVGGRASEKLPADAAEITILESDQLELAQDGVQALKTAAIVLVVLALGLMALAVYLARGWRREALRASGWGLVFAGATALIARGLAGDAVVGALAKTASVKPAAEAAWSIGTSLHVEAASAAIAYGVVLILAAWLAGPTRPAVATRRTLAPYIREPRLAYGALAVIVLLLVAWGPTPALRRAIPTLILIALLALGVEVLRRQAAREFPDASRAESAARMRERAAKLGQAFRRGGGGAEEDRYEQLERLGRLRDSGVLDTPEFEREKAQLLGVAPVAPAAPAAPAAEETS
ncbi:MAG: SHOCT domain-containing protein [Thermoleophilaceae bacterium]|nr:SHOCT domain-containing protein [Thermoleophilaceae bacterium]